MAQDVGMSVPVQVDVRLQVGDDMVRVGTATIQMQTTGLKYDPDDGSAYVELVAHVGP